MSCELRCQAADQWRNYYLAKANTVAEQVLREFNSSDLSPQFGGPLKLIDYQATVKETESQGKTFIILSYKLKKPVSFQGHPQHFDVWVEKNTGKTQIFKGR